MSCVCCGVDAYAVASMRKTEAYDITVLMPVHNGEEYLQEQIDSILQQTGVNIRLVVCDDASTDASPQILDDLNAQYGNVEVISNGRNIGLIGSLERLLSNVKSEYFALADQDDIWDPDKLVTSIHYLTQTGAALVYSDVRLVDPHGAILADSYISSRGMRPICGRDPIPFVFQNPVVGHTIVAKSELARISVPIPRYLHYHEPWLVCRAVELGSVVYLDRTTGCYRQHGANVVGGKPKSVFARSIQALLSKSHRMRRASTRASALRALALYHPDVWIVQDAYTEGAAVRLRHLGSVIRLMARYRQLLGWRTVAVEVLAFAFTRATIDRGHAGCDA